MVCLGTNITVGAFRTISGPDFSASRGLSVRDLSSSSPGATAPAADVAATAIEPTRMKQMPHPTRRPCSLGWGCPCCGLTGRSRQMASCVSRLPKMVSPSRPPTRTRTSHPNPALFGIRPQQGPEFQIPPHPRPSRDRTPARPHEATQLPLMRRVSRLLCSPAKLELERANS